MQSTGFRPFAQKDARLLILGSLPGRLSLERAEYYAHPQNAFWRIMGELVGAKPELPYKLRIAKLNAAGIALWDVCSEGFRPGSLDSDISKPLPNDFETFFRTHKHIKRIAFNVQKAYALYRRMVLPHLPEPMQAIEQVVLPSTSPAHASLTFAQKWAKWKEAITPMF